MTQTEPNPAGGHQPAGRWVETRLDDLLLKSRVRVRTNVPIEGTLIELGWRIICMADDAGFDITLSWEASTTPPKVEVWTATPTVLEKFTAAPVGTVLRVRDMEIVRLPGLMAYEHSPRHGSVFSVPSLDDIGFWTPDYWKWPADDESVTWA